MNIYNWYKIVNKTEFEDTGLVSRTLTVFLDGIGLRDIMITKGNMISILYDDVFLSVDMSEKNPFEFDSHAVYLDADDYIWMGILSEA